MDENRFRNPDYFISRELSWLEFNQRVMEEAKDKKIPLLERFKFLAIVTSNLDEFFMVRVGSLYDQVQAGIEKKDAAGLTPKQQLKRVVSRAHQMMQEQYEIYKKLVPQLKKEGIQVVSASQLKKEELAYLDSYFKQEVYPVLTPMAVDASRPFPLILNRSLNIALLIEREKEETFATVQVPAVLVQRNRADNPGLLLPVRLSVECDVPASLQPVEDLPHPLPSRHLDRGCLDIAVIDQLIIFAFQLCQVAAPSRDLDVLHAFLRADNRDRAVQDDALAPAVRAVPDKIAGKFDSKICFDCSGKNFRRNRRKKFSCRNKNPTVVYGGFF